jgi:glycosyltransferase involved in cell wall biosynthesis
MRLLIVQYAGDYRETVRHFAEGGEETYYAQRYSVDTVAELAQKIDGVTVICCRTSEAYDEVLVSGVRVIGGGFDHKIPLRSLVQLIEQQAPTYLILRTPILAVLRWAIRRKIPTIALFADSFSTKGWHNLINNYRFAKALNHRQIEWVGNHNINASKSLRKIGVSPDKIIPYDFIATSTPAEFAPKKLRNHSGEWQLFYIGAMSETKGIGDLLEAVSKLRINRFPVTLRIVGRDQGDFFLNRARELKIDEFVEFLGVMPNHRVVPLMRSADAVVVPSRHEYPDGFPLTIYHALCSRTPLIISDHPMFQTNLKNGLNAMIFSASDSASLAACIEKLLSEQSLYFNLSVASEAAWEQLQIPVKWADMINRWLFSSPENNRWLFDHRLSSGVYDHV